MALLGSHPAFQDDDILGELREPLCDCLQVVLALGDHDRGSPGFESREDVVENHVIASRVAGQEAIELLNRARRIGFLPLGTECSLLDHNPV